MSEIITMDTIKRCVKTLLESQKSIAEMNKTIKVKRKVLNDSKETTQRFLEQNDLLVLDVGSHELALKERVTAATLNKEFLGTAAKDFLTDKGIDNSDEWASELVEYVWKRRADSATKKMFLSVKKAPKKKVQKRKISEIQGEQAEESEQKDNAVEDVSVESL